MPEAATLPLADTSDMAGIHNVFKSALGDAPALVGSAVGRGERPEMVATYYDNVLRLLHAHHEGEDELLTPRLVERATADEAAAASRIAEQHQSVLADLAAAEERLAAFRAQPDAASAATFAAALSVLSASLTAHLDEEERVVVPMAARYINVAEWGELPQHGFASFTGDKVWLIIGLIQEQMTPEQIDDMLAHMPPPVVDLWVTTWQQTFREFVTELRVGR